MTLRPSIHWLLIAMPLAAALDASGVAAPLVFLCAALAIVPLAGLIVHSTEHLATIRARPSAGSSTRHSATCRSSSSRWWRYEPACSRWSGPR